jgi:hypothetical protein
MAQTIKLKRTAVQGKIPTTSNLDLGELAINTHDGRLFFQKDDGTLSIQEILTTNSQTSGSFNLTGAISASSLSISGDTTIGGNLTLGGNITIGDASTDSVTVTAQFSGSLIPDGNEIYDLGSSVKKWNNTYTKNLIATNITATSFTGSIAATNGIVSGSSQIDHDTTTNFVANEHIDHSSITLGSGKGLSGGGTIDTNRSLSLDTGSNHFVNGVKSKLDAELVLSGSNLDGMTVSGSFSGSFIGDGSGLTGIQVDQIASITSSFSEQSTINVSHNFGTYNVIVSTYDSNYNQLIPQTVSLTDTNTVQVVLSSAHSGHVVVAKGGHILDTSELTSYREDVSGASSYAITHSLDESYPFVQAWNTSTSMIEQPLSVESNSANVITVSFAGTFDGKIIVKK